MDDVSAHLGGKCRNICYFYWPASPQAAPDPAFIYQLDREQRKLLVNENEAAATLEVKMPNGYILRFGPNVDQQDAERVARAYHDISVRTQVEFNQHRAQ